MILSVKIALPKHNREGVLPHRKTESESNFKEKQ